MLLLQGVTTQCAPDLMVNLGHQIAVEAEVDPKLLPMVPADLTDVEKFSGHEDE